MVSASSVKARVVGSSGWAEVLPSPSPGAAAGAAAVHELPHRERQLSLELCFPPGGGSLELTGMFLVPRDVVRARRQRWFAYLHMLNPHLPYIASPAHTDTFGAGDYGPEPVPIPEGALKSITGQRIPGVDDLREYRARYDAAIHEADEGLGRVLAALEEQDLLEQTLVVVTSDHGQEFLEHGRLAHAGQPWEVLLRVPLLVRYPGGAHGGARFSEPVSLLDIYPTITELMGFEAGRQVRGVALNSLARGTRKQNPSRVFVTTHTPMAAHKDTRVDVVIQGGLKLFAVHRPSGLVRFRLYDLRSDPGETDNLAPRRPHAVEFLAETLDAERCRQVGQRPPGPCPIPTVAPDAAELQLLRQLGYVDDEGPGQASRD
jgi:arylsulfatase A-like enzyme